MAPHRPSRELAYVVQKHAARSLHFDFRLELDGVMKSWAIPKGPSTDPAVKRLAMPVDDHELSYNAFEGTLPAGSYGAGTVMLWDVGHYEYDGPDARTVDDPEAALRRAYERGELRFVLHGQRLRGAWALVRMRRGRTARTPWLLVKQRDEYADTEHDVVVEYTTSVATGRRMEGIRKDEEG